jgi:hypothetical protein
MGLGSFVLLVWLFAEWMLRPHNQRKSEERFGNIISPLK